MKKAGLVTGILVLLMAACGTDESGQSGSNSLEDQGTVVFGQTSWTSTEAPTEIARLMLEEMGHEVDISLLDQPVIFEGMQNQEVDFFMDAWLPYTEAALWAEYEDDLIQVATSYENVPLGWVVPDFVEVDSIADLHGNEEMFDSEIVTIGEGAGIVDLSWEVMADEAYQLDEFTLHLRVKRPCSVSWKIK